MDVLHEVCLGRQTGNEENVKVKLVVPILELLGYDPIRDFDYERHVERGRPDIVLLVGDSPRLIVEAKGLDKDLEEHKVQGLGYAGDAGIPWTVLTNGVQWDLYKTFIAGVPHSENEPIFTILSKDLPSRFGELESLIARQNIESLERIATPQVEHVARKAKVSDLARMSRRFRASLFSQLRNQFDDAYAENTSFTQKVDQWVSEQGVDKNYDWYRAFKDDKKFRSYILSVMKQNGLPSTRSEFDETYRKTAHEGVTQSINVALRQEGIPIDWPDKLCFEGAYSLINRILFLRICEDSGFIAREISDELILKLRKARDNEELVTRLDGIFAAMRAEYPGVYKLPLLDHLQLGDLEWDAGAIADLCAETLRYNFAELGDVLGDLYQRHVDLNARRLIGQFYTHEEKVDFMLESVRPWLQEDAKLLDPACGSGSFLVGAYKILHPVLVASGYSASSAHRHLLEDVLYGIDIDSFAAQLAAINLLVRNMEEPVGSLRVYVGNSLTGDDTLSRFGLEVPTPVSRGDPREVDIRSPVGVLELGSFDIVLGNPPFFRVGLSDPIYGGMLRSAEYSMIRPEGAEMNMATMFLKRGIDLLKDSVEVPRGRGGVGALIMPKSLTYVDEYRLVREYLLSRCRILKIVDLGRGWPDVGLEHVIVVFERKLPGVAQDTEAPLEVIHKVASFRRVLYDKHEVDPRVFRNDPKKRLLVYVFGTAREIYEQMNRIGRPLNKANFRMTVWEGIRDDHGVRRFRSKQNARSVPLLNGSSVRRWFAAPSEYVDGTDVRIPRGIKDKCRATEKIVIKRVISSKVRIEATIDRNKSITHSSTTAVTFQDGTSIQYVTGILNSRLMNLYVRDWIFNRTELTMNFREEYLSEIPVAKEPSASIMRAIETSVEKLETISEPFGGGEQPTPEQQRTLAEVKAELDAAVYDLYGLAASQRAFVESLMPYSD